MFFKSFRDEGIGGRRGGVLPRQAYPLVRLAPRVFCSLVQIEKEDSKGEKRAFLSFSLFSFFPKEKEEEGRKLSELPPKINFLTCQLAVGRVLHPPRVAVAVQGPVGLDACFVLGVLL